MHWNVGGRRMRFIWCMFLSGFLVLFPSATYAVDGAGMGWLEFVLLPLILPALLISSINTSSRPSYSDDPLRSCDVYSYVVNKDGAYKRCFSPLTRKNVNDRPYEGKGYCLLELSVMSGNVQAFNELIEYGADPKKCSGYPSVFYTFAYCNNDFLERFESLDIAPSDPQKVFISAARRNCVPATKIAIKYGADVNQLDEKGFSALYYVFNNLSTGMDTASFLISAGADPFLPTSIGESPYEKAKCLYGKGADWPKMEQLLFGKRLVPNKRNDSSEKAGKSRESFGGRVRAEDAVSVEVNNQTPSAADKNFQIFELPNAPRKESRSASDVVFSTSQPHRDCN